jgi:hypothetical protein
MDNATELQEVEVLSTCGHGVESKLRLKLPLAVEAMDCSELEDESLWVVWLMSKTEEGKEWYVVTVSEPTNCKPQADILVAAFRALLASPDGEKAAIEFIRHRYANGSEDLDDSAEVTTETLSPETYETYGRDYRAFKHALEEAHNLLSPDDINELISDADEEFG